MLNDLEYGLFVYQIHGMNKFPERYGSMRILLPNLHAMTWVNGPGKIVIHVGDTKISDQHYLIYPPGHKIFNHLIQYQAINPKVMMKDVLASYGFSNETFYVLTKDSLFREYAINKIVEHMMIIREKDTTWAIDGVNVPTGLKTREIVFLSSRHAGLFLKKFTDAEWSIWVNRVIPHYFGDKPESHSAVIRYSLEDSPGTMNKEIPVDLNNRHNLVATLKSILCTQTNLESISIQTAETGVE